MSDERSDDLALAWAQAIGEDRRRFWLTAWKQADTARHALAIERTEAARLLRLVGELEADRRRLRETLSTVAYQLTGAARALAVRVLSEIGA